MYLLLLNGHKPTWRFMTTPAMHHTLSKAQLPLFPHLLLRSANLEQHRSLNGTLVALQSLYEFNTSTRLSAEALQTTLTRLAKGRFQMRRDRQTSCHSENSLVHRVQARFAHRLQFSISSISENSEMANCCTGQFEESDSFRKGGKLQVFQYWC